MAAMTRSRRLVHAIFLVLLPVAVATLGVFFTGRTVPALRVRTGLVESVIGQSPEILRYLWGAYAAPLGKAADFLRPTKERLELEGKLDRYGANLQVWVYYHLLGDRELTLHAWGGNDPRFPEPGCNRRATAA